MFSLCSLTHTYTHTKHIHTHLCAQSATVTLHRIHCPTLNVFGVLCSTHLYARTTARLPRISARVRVSYAPPVLPDTNTRQLSPPPPPLPPAQGPEAANCTTAEADRRSPTGQRQFYLHANGHYDPRYDNQVGWGGKHWGWGWGQWGS